MLSVDGLYAGYGGGTVLHGITLYAEPGSVHTVTGANGAGKTTLVHTIAGLITPTAGRIRLGGADITHVAAHHRARAGIALVPQGRRVFASLTVAEHLAIAARRPTGPTPGLDRATVLELLPQLGARLGHRGAQLSGGEQQMLAIGRALLTQPRLLLLDEPTEGLAPGLATQIRALTATLTGGGLTILLTTPQTGPDPAMAGHTTTPTAATTTLGGHATPTPAGRTPTTTGPPGRPPAWAGLLTPPARPPPATPATPRPTPDDVPGHPGGATHNPIGETHAR